MIQVGPEYEKLELSFSNPPCLPVAAMNDLSNCGALVYRSLNFTI
jgi:hypothetical protein